MSAHSTRRTTGHRLSDKALDLYRRMPNPHVEMARATVFSLLDELQERRSAAPDEETRRDAERWRAFISSQRFKMMGSSGFVQDNDGRIVPAKEHLHFGLEVWNIHPEGDDPQGQNGRALLLAYVEELVHRRAGKEQRS